MLTAIAGALARHAGRPRSRISGLAWRQAHLARDFLHAHALHSVRSEELERITGIDRYALSRHFRAVFGTSPHRFLLMRRLQCVRQMIEASQPLAEVAAAAGFVDQSHMNRQFKKAFGLTPGRWAALANSMKSGRSPGDIFLTSPAEPPRLVL